MEHGQPHMPHLPHEEHGGPEHKLWIFRLDLIIAMLLGLAALTGALSAYGAHLAESHSSREFNQAVQSLNDSNFFYVQGNQKLQQDQLIFQQWITAAVKKETDLAVYIQKTLMSDELKKEVKWWTTGKNTDKYDSPFVSADPYYSIPEYAKGAELDKQTKALFNEGKLNEERSNRYTLVEVLIASALFLYGIASVTRGRRSIKLGFVGVGFALFAVSCVQLARVYFGA